MIPPARLSPSQAARCAGVSRTQIHRRIRSGGLSVERNEDGAVRIEPSELLRLYPDADLGRARTPGDRAHRRVHGDARNSAGTDALRRELELLRERVHGLETDKAHLRGEVDRLLGVLEQQQRLLTDRRQPRPGTGLGGWWRRLWAGA